MKKIFSLLLVAVLIFSLSVSVFALETSSLPDPYTVITEEFKERFPYHVVVKRSGRDEYRLLALSTEGYFTDDLNWFTQVSEKGEESLYYLEWEYRPSIDTNWISYSGYSTLLQLKKGTNPPEGSFYFKDVSYISSSYDVRSENGNIVLQADGDFFQLPPLPLWMETMEVTQGAIPTMVTAMAMNLSTLVACGIGLIALLMGLYLLARRFPLFLGK